MTAERPFNITEHPLEHYWSDRKRALADLGYYLGKTYIDDPVTPRSCWLRSDGAGSSVPVTEGEQALIDLFLAAEGLDAHPGEHHEFRTTCKRCGEDGTLVISLITYDQQVRIEERAASQPVAEEGERPARRPRAHHVRPPGAEIGAKPTWEDPS